SDLDDVSALNNLALLLNEMRQFAEAESLALRATALRLSPPPFGNAIRAQIGLGKLAEAAKTVDRFEQRAAGNPFLLVFRSRLAEARRAYDSAEAYQRARLQGTDLARRANTYFTLAALHLVRGRLAEAEAAGAVAMAEGRTPDAIAGYRAWYDESGCATCGLFELARAYERAGERDSALAVYQRAVTTPGRDRLLDEAATLGATYKRLGEL